MRSGQRDIAIGAVQFDRFPDFPVFVRRGAGNRPVGRPKCIIRVSFKRIEGHRVPGKQALRIVVLLGEFHFRITRSHFRFDAFNLLVELIIAQS